MPKLRRLVVPGYPHHITQRGVRRQTTFFDERDYQTYLRIAEDQLGKSTLEILCYCLMPNHIHAIVIPGNEKSLAAFFGSLHKYYAQMTNRKYEWTGHLWQARFFSVPMDRQHTLTAMRYVELNPLRSKLVRRPQDWPWSSARGNLGLVDDPLIPDRPALDIASPWADYLATNENPEELKQLRRQTGTGRPSGNRAFLDRIEMLTGRNMRKRRPGRHKK